MYIIITTVPRGRDWSGILLWSLRNKRYSGKPGARRHEQCDLDDVFWGYCLMGLVLFHCGGQPPK